MPAVTMNHNSKADQKLWAGGTRSAKHQAQDMHEQWGDMCERACCSDPNHACVCMRLESSCIRALHVARGTLTVLHKQLEICFCCMHGADRRPGVARPDQTPPAARTVYNIVSITERLKIDNARPPRPLH